MLSRRTFLWAAAAAVSCTSPKLTHKDRVDRTLRGADLDRPPFSFWYHFGLEGHPPEHHAEATLDFHRKFRTDLVKVMSDFPYPRPAGNWWELREEKNPFPEQIRALEIIRDGLAGSAYFIETIFNPWNVAEKLSSRQAVLQLKEERPQALTAALEVISRSEANHARRALEAGAVGIFLAIANADPSVLSEQDYARFSEPFDQAILDAARGAPLNTLHLHGEHPYLDHFYRGWSATVIHYSAHGAGVPLAEVRSKFGGVLMGGIDERKFRTASEAELRAQWQAAQEAAGNRFILAPGCSVPDETPDEEMMRLVRVLGA